MSAEKQLRDTIRDAYEPEWPDREHLTAIFDVSFENFQRILDENLFRIWTFKQMSSRRLYVMTCHKLLRNM